MRRGKRALLVLAMSTVTACGGGGSAPAPPTTGGGNPPVAEEAPGLWVRTGTDGDAVASYTGKLTTFAASQRLPDAAVLEAAPVADSAVSDGAGFSSTYTLEQNVDEYDSVKYNGTTLAIAPTRSGCCFFIEPLATSDALLPPTESASDSHIELYQTDPGLGSASLTSVIELDDGQSAEGMYLSGSRLQVLLSTAWWGVFGDRLTVADGWMGEQVSLINYDVSDPENPAVVSELTIEGALLTSRRAGDEIHIISRHAPTIEGLIYYPQTEEAIAANNAVLSEVSADDILPEIRRDGALVTPLSLDACYRMDPTHPLARPAPSDSTLTTFLVVSSETGAILRSACTLEPVSGVYMGDSLIALTHVRWDLDDGGTMVHVLERDTLAYRGSEQIAGALYSGGNADFRISEANGVIRVVTTDRTGDSDDAFRHRLFTLAPEDGAQELDVLGVLGNTPDSRIGKPNEDLYGVRFMGDRAYLVTFERIDPLYVIDLTDARQPTIVGELEVPGFSDLLHEVSGDLLLGLGSSERRFPKLELYDISDVTQPLSQGIVELGQDMRWAYSPAQYNRLAFTYLAGDGVDRLTVPYSAGGIDGEDYVQVDRVALFEIRNKDLPAEATIAAVGEVSLTAGAVDGDTRVVLDGDALYVISQSDFLGGLWSNPQDATEIRAR